MRKIIITRKKSFVGSIIPYFVNVTNDDITKQYKIKNKEIITIDASENEVFIRVSANTSTGAAFSEPLKIEEGTNDIYLEIVTKYNWIKGSSYEIIRI